MWLPVIVGWMIWTFCTAPSGPPLPAVQATFPPTTAMPSSEYPLSEEYWVVTFVYRVTREVRVAYVLGIPVVVRVGIVVEQHRIGILQHADAPIGVLDDVAPQCDALGVRDEHRDREGSGRRKPVKVQPGVNR
ncbi:MAG: hypothetical protein ACLQAT_19055 [Candidatus Binataceae bacterium]